MLTNYIRAQGMLDPLGVHSKRMRYILFDMIEDGSSYTRATEDYAEWVGDTYARVHANNCRDLLRVGREEHPRTLLERLAAEARR